MNVVSPGVSTSQMLLLIPIALSLAGLAMLLWTVHRMLQRTIVVLPLRAVLQPVGVCDAVDPVRLASQAFALRLSTRAPPTFHKPSIPVTPETSALVPGNVLTADASIILPDCFR